MNLKDLVEAYVRANLLADATESTYWYVARSIRDDFDGRYPELTEMTQDWVEGYRNRQLKKTSPTTFNSKRRHMMALLAWAITRNLAQQNVFKGIRPVPVPQKPPKAIPAQQLDAYFQILETATSSDRWGNEHEMFQPQWFWLAVTKTLYLTGMRRRQLVGLRWADVDFTTGSILLRSETSKSRREWTIPLPDQLRPHLVNLHVNTTQLCGEIIGPRQVFCLPLFSQWKRLFCGEEMTAAHVDRFFKRFCKALPTDSMRFTSHRIRHTTATVLARKALNLRVVQSQLGHTSIHTTMQYVHPDLNDLRVAANLL
jgi:integrase